MNYDEMLKYFNKVHERIATVTSYDGITKSAIQLRKFEGVQFPRNLQYFHRENTTSREYFIITV